MCCIIHHEPIPIRFMSTLRTVSFLLLLMTMLTSMARADFPDVDQLSERADLPDPLVMFDGTPVRTAQEWREKRRPELIKLFEWYMYGAAPAPAKIAATVERVDEVLDGKARMKQVTITFGPAGNERGGRINLLLFVPAAPKAPAPVMLGLNFRGNHMVLAHPAIPLPTLWMPNGPGMVDNRATEAGRGLEAPHWPLASVIERGYAVATFYHGDVKLDKPTWDDGVPGLFFPSGQTEPTEHQCATIAAWAWGLSRAVDYLVTDADIDARRIAVFGHSRNGKTALLAGALDERFALVIPSQAGCGGTSPSRGTVGESVERINTVFPHWFNGTFKKFNRATSKLPLDQHCLMALCRAAAAAVDQCHRRPMGQPERAVRNAQGSRAGFQALGDRRLRRGTDAARESTGQHAPGLFYSPRQARHEPGGMDAMARFRRQAFAEVSSEVPRVFVYHRGRPAAPIAPAVLPAKPKAVHAPVVSLLCDAVASRRGDCG